MFRCDHHHQGAYCVSLLMLQCYNIWLKYIIVVNLAVWLHMLSGPCWCMSAAPHTVCSLMMVVITPKYFGAIAILI